MRLEAKFVTHKVRQFPQVGDWRKLDLASMTVTSEIIVIRQFLFEIT